MDLGRPASLLLPSGTSAVLSALAGTDSAMGVRELARVAGVSPNRASVLLAELAEHGVVSVQLHAGLRLCRLNRAHLATEALVALVRLRARLIEFLRDELGSWQAPPAHATLFGSGARGDGNTSSDLDLLVVRPATVEEDRWQTQLYDSGLRIRLATGNAAAWFSVTAEELRSAARTEKHLLQQWRRDAIHLLGPWLDDVLLRAV